MADMPPEVPHPDKFSEQLLIMARPKKPVSEMTDEERREFGGELFERALSAASPRPE